MKYLLTFTLSFFALSVHAITITWVGSTSQDWHDSSNWSPSQVPTGVDDVIISGNALPVEILFANANAQSLTMNIGLLLVGSGQTLTVAGMNPLHPTTVHFVQSVLVNSGSMDITGAMYAEDNSLINNDGGIFLNGNQDNTPISLELTDNTSLLNSNSSAFINFRDNIEPTTGNHKQLYLKIDDNSYILNGGSILATYNTFTQDWVEKGIEINNNSYLTNQIGSTIFLESVREIGIHVKNDSNVAPNSALVNYGTIDISKCTVCSYGELTCGIRVEENAQFYDYPPGSNLTITDYTDVNDNDICIDGVIGSFGNIGGPAVDMGNYTFDPLAVLEGTGVIIIDNGLNSHFTATVSPGGSQAGKMAFEGNFTSTSTTKFKMQIEGMGGPGMMMGHDQIDWGTDETTISMSTLIVEATGGFTPDVGDQFQIFTGLVSGEFENLDLPGGNDSWQITYDPNGVVLEVIAPINNIYNTGIGTTTPRTKLEVSGGDILLSSIGTGVVLTSPGGQFYKVTVDDNGALQTELIPCPEVWECP